MKNKELLIEELEVTGVSQVSELINDVAENVISEPQEELPITESEVDVEAMAMDDLFEKGKADTKLKVEAKIKEKQPQLSKLTPEERAIEIRKITLAYWEEFQAKYLTEEALGKYIDDNWDNILAEVKRRKELKKQNEQISNESQPELEIKQEEVTTEQVIDQVTEQVKTDLNEPNGFEKYTFNEKYGKYFYPDKDSPVLELIDNGAEFTSTEKRLSAKLPDGMVIPMLKVGSLPVLMYSVLLQQNKPVPAYMKKQLAEAIFSQHFITELDIQKLEFTVPDDNYDDISEHKSIPVEMKDTILNNGNTLREYLDEQNLKIELTPDKKTVNINGVPLDKDWNDKLNISRSSNPFLFVESDYYKNYMKQQEEPKQLEIDLPFIQKKEEPKLVLSLEDRM